jgi:3-oxoacyl-[acyl-carrier-protein] synthase-1/3-oxoacyl-[acyl-carrier-protein] synthase II
MIPVAVVARGAISPLGRGERATAPGLPGERPSSMVREDAELRAAGFAKPRSARAPLDGTWPEADRAGALLDASARDLVAALDAVLPDWRARRVALSVGTSAGGMVSLERALALRSAGEPLPPGLARAALYDGPLAALAPWFGAATPRVALLGACVASTFALGLGARWLGAGLADLVIAGGYDALSLLVATGFEALGATSASVPAPFAAARDGMVLGEGAALLALMRADEAPRVEGIVYGFAATSDATHVTAPEPHGDGLLRAVRAALDDAGAEPSAIELVSAHATATPHNDAAEARALARALGDGVRSVPVHAMKRVIGHTLGAAGALETLAAIDAMRAGVVPGAGENGALEPGCPLLLPETNLRAEPRLCLKLSAAFGGANAALVVGPPAGRASAPARPTRSVTLLHAGSLVRAPDLELLATRSGLDELRRSRLDRASALTLTAAALALEFVPELAPETTAVVVGTFAASLEANELFDARRRARGPTGVEPRRFPATSPNLPAGWCTIAFGWRGPSIAVGGGPDALAAALAVGFDLVAAGDAEHAVVIESNDVGSVTRDLCAAAGLAEPTDGARALVLGTDPRGRPVDRIWPGHP